MNVTIEHAYLSQYYMRFSLRIYAAILLQYYILRHEGEERSPVHTLFPRLYSAIQISSKLQTCFPACGEALIIGCKMTSFMWTELGGFSRFHNSVNVELKLDMLNIVTRFDETPRLIMVVETLSCKLREFRHAISVYNTVTNLTCLLSF